MNSTNLSISIFLLILTLSLATTDANACRVINRALPSELVDRADVIVRAMAERYVDEPKGELRYLNEPPDVTINFKVNETLKGEYASKNLVLNGYLSTRDDFNDGEIPYNFVRPGGRGGSCSAYEYKQGSEFLLFLKRVDGKYTIRWSALAPTNEQLHSPDDKWLNWVRHYLKPKRKAQ